MKIRRNTQAYGLPVGIIEIELTGEEMERAFREVDHQYKTEGVKSALHDAYESEQISEELYENEYKGTDAAAIICAIMENDGVRLTELADRMGCTRQNISQMLTRGTAGMRYDSFYKLADTLGYEISVRKK